MHLEKIEKPWGYEEIIVNNGRYVVKEICIKKGTRSSFQFHKVKDETLFVMRGLVKVLVDNSEHTSFEEHGPCEIIDIPHKTVHRVIALEDTVIIETSTIELDDVVRIDDDYDRECR